MTCSEACWDSHARGVRGCSVLAGNCYAAQGSLLGTFVFQITWKNSVVSEGNPSDSSEQDLCLLYRPSPGKPQP